jgi:peptidoglycan biosynthesis protein MviN/MurJ (putative lipid II flippase)
MKSAWEKIVKASALLMALLIFKDVIGLMKQVVITAQFGTSDTMDGYFVANTLVAVILAWLYQPLERTIIPIFRYDLTQRGEQAAWANFSTLLTASLPMGDPFLRAKPSAGAAPPFPTIGMRRITSENSRTI